MILWFTFGLCDDEICKPAMACASRNCFLAWQIWSVCYTRHMKQPLLQKEKKTDEELKVRFPTTDASAVWLELHRQYGLQGYETEFLPLILMNNRRIDFSQWRFWAHMFYAEKMNFYLKTYSIDDAIQFLPNIKTKRAMFKHKHVLNGMERGEGFFTVPRSLYLESHSNGHSS